MLTSLFTDFLTTSLTTSLVIFVLIMLSSTLGKHYTAKWKYWIWMVLGVKLLLPFNFPFINIDNPIEIQVPQFLNTEKRIPSSIQNSPFIQNPMIATQQPGESVGYVPSLIDVVVWIWIIGIAFFLLYHFIGYYLFRKEALRWSSTIINKAASAKIKQVFKEMKVSATIAVLISGKVPNPMLTGFKKPILFLPHEAYSEDELEFIIKHELVHYKRNDLLYKLLLLFVQAIHWFNPFVWIMVREASREIEIYCDDTVVREQGLAYRKKYCETILSGMQNTPHLALSTNFSGRHNFMKQRFKNILNINKKRNGVIPFCIVLLLLGAIALLSACTNIVNGQASFKLGTIYSKGPDGKMITYDAGNSYSVDEEGKVSVSYQNGKVKVDVPLKLDTSGSVLGMGEGETGFFLSEDKTAIVYGFADEESSSLHVLTSDDMGKTWNNYSIEGARGYVRKYIGFTTKKEGWIVTSNPANLGSAHNYVFQTSDGGKTWEEISNPNDLYAQHLTGVGFSNKDIGFLGFRYYEDYGPTIYWTNDQGKSWEKLTVTLPKKFAEIRKNPLSPIFNGNEGLLPIQLYGESEGITGTIFLTTKDHGLTWVYDESYDKLDQ